MWYTCDECGAEFDIIVNAPTVNYEPPLYCPYCGGSIED